ncbi:hypothetical protein C5D07_14485 [Rathayibacter tritici]|uniref:Uncharacterized protein n=2 Tax=Rathayibacter tritici TaxID=33888 RepID=A0A160KUL5_9MICO|nr:hypothetical protein A6122_2220 [Rathayibacter tritici]PPF23359.1 hypothetical protein C5C06_14165 [Rathayibacter tritici]PPI11162.1 hypothetical protein C5D07_14485 [Rathayibacter tritici]PPI41239.1 hypothetical protein C5D18_14620 [Rathayibacter tritici]
MGGFYPVETLFSVRSAERKRTNRMTKKTRDLIIASSDWTIPAEDGVHRRTIVKGAAWTVPVVAMSVATPAAAASDSPTLAFTQAKYTGTGCATITSVQVKRTTDGTTADPGKVVTVTLSDGYTFADGTTSYSGTTNANGLITLPDIKVPAKGGDSSFGASSDTLSASAPVSSTSTSSLYRRNLTTGSVDGPDTVPGDSTVVGNYASLAPDGTLHEFDNATAVAKKVTSAVSQVGNNGNRYVTYIIGTTLYRKNLNTGTSDTTDTIPADSTVVGNTVSLAPDGTLHQLGEKTAIATGVTSALAEIGGNNGTYVTYIVGTSLYRKTLSTGAVSDPDTVPKDSIVVGNTVSLAPDGTLHQLGVTTAIATGVTSAVAQIGSNNETYVTYIVGTSLYRKNLSTGKVDTSDTVPANSTVVGNLTSLAPDGTLHQLGTTTAIATGVTSAVADINPANNDSYVTYVKPAC